MTRVEPLEGYVTYVDLSAGMATVELAEELVMPPGTAMFAVAFSKKSMASRVFFRLNLWNCLQPLRHRSYASASDVALN